MFLREDRTLSLLATPRSGVDDSAPAFWLAAAVLLQNRQKRTHGMAFVLQLLQRVRV